MKISEDKAKKLYKSISDPIMETRIAVYSGASLEEIDKILFDLETEISNNVDKVLNLTKS
jgi:hypothetical protein